MLGQKKIGILGGGQLGAMLLRHAIDLGLQVSVLDKDKNTPCSRYTSSFVVGDPTNFEDVVSFGIKLHAITIEKEAVNVAGLKYLRDKGVKIYPAPEVIEIIQDKYLQKRFLSEHGIAHVPGRLVLGKDDLEQHTKKFPACLKKCLNGYDGRGVMMLREAADVEHAFDEPCVLEQLVDIKHELSVIVCRNQGGCVACYDPVLMIFNKERMLLDYQVCPARIDTDTAANASNLAIATAEALNLVGIMAVEMFVTNDGKLYVNELAPRPHNSGHHTIEACKTSQFEQLLRILLGLPFGSTVLTSPSVMVNILEPRESEKDRLIETLKQLLGEEGVHLHWYGKAGGREGRKMGHITITGSDSGSVLSKATIIRNLLKNGK